MRGCQRLERSDIGLRALLGMSDEVGIDRAGVHRVGNNAVAGQPLRQSAGEEDIRELGMAIGSAGAVIVAHLEIVPG